MRIEHVINGIVIGIIVTLIKNYHEISTYTAFVSVFCGYLLGTFRIIPINFDVEEEKKTRQKLAKIWQKECCKY